VLIPREPARDGSADFVLRAEISDVPDLAIFCDGWSAHATPTANRLSRDAEERRLLRDAGWIVIGLSDSDLAPRRDMIPIWINEPMISVTTNMSDGALTPTVTSLLRSGPLELIMWWLQSPDPEAMAALADWLPMMMVGKTDHIGISSGIPILDEASGLLDGKQLVGAPTSAWAWADDTVVFMARKAGNTAADTEVALVLADDDARLGQAHAESWRTWLRVSNYLNLRTRPTVIGVTSETGSVATTGSADETSDPVPEPLREDYAMAGAEVRPLMLEIHEAGLETPSYGIEVGDGIPLEVAWPTRMIAIDLDLDERDRQDLGKDGWVLVRASLDDIRRALETREA
jgi:hypothetical protein